MVMWLIMYMINFIFLYVYFIFCINYLLENRIEFCIVIYDRCMYRKKWYEVWVFKENILVILFFGWNMIN